MLRPFPARYLGASCVLAAALALTGCSDGLARTSVSGKVTQAGQPVSGTVAFIDATNKEYASPIGADGHYQIVNPPSGKLKIVVRGMPALPKTRAPAPGADLRPLALTGGTAPHRRYSQPNNGLTVDVKDGEQEFDVTLNP